MLDPNKSTVLIVDPSASNRSLISECLAQLPDVQTVVAANGAQALNQFCKHHPSLVLMDIALHDTDGLSIAKSMRSWERSAEQPGVMPWTPIVFLSTVMDEDILAEGIMAGGDDFLYKPVSEVVLLAKVRALLRIVCMQKEIHEAHRQIKALSLLDGLTNIPNRRHFDETLRTEWRRCSRLKAPLSIVIGDVDFFKQFNDIYGHQAGDECLKAVAGALNESLFRVEDIVARYGGEEFAAILPGTDAIGAQAVAERMRSSARELCIPHQGGVGGLISCSFGVASMVPSCETPAPLLLQAADESLYAAKRNGRNQIRSLDQGAQKTG
ncbi:diguanylate cyclase [Dechloromonas sp. TW-R-39-2]|uniref:GGDEF domain-containing response regulator n=1 Tax=Dechloromonas sp. TW-R-39-2 TaxID=2654218 RepID=UPI00193D6BE2|nr:diguanylate cyclase [Dechloromonas sp. TW-R-39-2]QRM20546.1 diguanylate cyclase [Dechloromonas sp. TW-R-39-2]